MPSKIGTGLFPREVMQRFPLLPLEEEGYIRQTRRAKSLTLTEEGEQRAEELEARYTAK